MRTLEDIERDYEQAKREAEPIIKAREEAVHKINLLYKEMEDYKIQHDLFNPMSDLEKYKGKEISHIKLVVRNDDGTFETKDMYNDELFKVDENGHLDYSSYNNGIMSYIENKGKYVFCYYGHETWYDFAGYLEICFYEDN